MAPLVDVTRSSPLKNEPFSAFPFPENSMRNGTSTLLTVTTASQRPVTDCAPAGAMGPSSALTRTMSGIIRLRFIRLQKEKARKAFDAFRAPGVG